MAAPQIGLMYIIYSTPNQFIYHTSNPNHLRLMSRMDQHITKERHYTWKYLGSHLSKRKTIRIKSVHSFTFTQIGDHGQVQPRTNLGHIRVFQISISRNYRLSPTKQKTLFIKRILLNNSVVITRRNRGGLKCPIINFTKMIK